VGRDVRTSWTVGRLEADLVAAHTSHAHTCCTILPRRLVVHRRVDFMPSGGWKYRRPDGYVAVSEAVARIVRAAGGSLVQVVPDGVSTPPVVPPAVDGPTVLAVGARVAHKGHRYLAEASRYMADVDVGVAGEGELVYPGIRWLGRRDDIPALLAAARVFVQPSVEEGMGQAVIEAMAAGVPVVVTDTGGLPEVVGDTGIVVPRSDARALAQGIQRALAGEHPPIEAARERAARFSVDAMVDGTLAAYARVLDGCGGTIHPRV
jgi:glycosyltransferase involved in cell wall biosynthesis